LITFDTPIARFSYRVAAVILRGGCVLLCRDGEQGHLFLPGGRCELLEPSTVTVTRELREELGVDARPDRLLYVVENFFNPEQAMRIHELGFYYLVALPPDTTLLDAHVGELFQGAETDLRLYFSWHPIDDLEQLQPPLYPEFLRTALQHIPDTIQHIVNVELPMP